MLEIGSLIEGKYKILNNEDNLYIIKNVYWNQDIPIGGSVSFGFSGNGNQVDYPERYEIFSKKQYSNEDNYDVKFNLYSNWGFGFSGAIEI
jgi:hypothetical protein